MTSILIDQIDGYDLVLLDLDGTLYRERDYLFAGYRAIGALCEAHYDVNGFQVERLLRNRFVANGRKQLFQHVCAAFDLPDDIIPSMMECLHRAEVEGGLALYPPMVDFLRNLRARRVRHCIVTNGTPTQQRNKIRQLIPADCVRDVPIYYATSVAPKPDPAALLAAVADFGTYPERAIMIGNSEEDCSAAAAAGCGYLDATHIVEGSSG